jgi:hypothetical protein
VYFNTLFKSYQDLNFVVGTITRYSGMITIPWSLIYLLTSPSNCLWCNLYFSYGFIFIQDIIEKGKKLII